MPTRPQHVWLYGNDHSPWVQAVLLGLHEKGIAHTLVTAPPLPVFLSSGILMPAAKLDDGPWVLDSERILVALGFSEVDPEVRQGLRATFGSAAFRRTDDPWEFWRRFSWVRDGHPSPPRRLWNQLWRPFSMLYFFTLITLARRSRPLAATERLAGEFAFFQERLSPGEEFLGGPAPDTADLQLFGLVQMCASIPGPPLDVLRREPKLERLRAWIEAMQRRFCDDDRLYSGPYFRPELPEMEPAPAAERACYWSGAALMWILLPITVPLALFIAHRTRKKGLQQP